LLGHGEGTSGEQMWALVLLALHLLVDELASRRHGLPCV